MSNKFEISTDISGIQNLDGYSNFKWSYDYYIVDETGAKAVTKDSLS